MSRTAQAVVLPGDGRPYAVEELELEEPRAGEVLVRLGASGVCHSDLHVVDGDWPVPTPVCLGHEGAGTVEAVGPGVRDVAPGDRVVLSWFAPCRRCRHCAAGRAWACTRTRSEEMVLEDGTPRLRRPGGEPVLQYLGVGTFSTRAVVPESAAVKVPGAVPLEVAALIGCAVTTGVGAVTNNARVPPGASAVVVGCGGVGLNVVLGLRLAGAEPIVAVDLADARLQLARELGATHALRGDREDLAAAVGDLTGGGADFAFEAIGSVATIEALPGLLTSGGVGVLVGLPAAGVRARLDVLAFAEAGKTLVGSNYGGAVPAVDFPRIAGLYLAGRLPLDRLVSARVGLGELDAAFAAMRRREGLRTVVVHD
jgi:S-(hydroxymethyl)glutathione dehydrogenase/alcohol dehydrogenase